MVRSPPGTTRCDASFACTTLVRSTLWDGYRDAFVAQHWVVGGEIFGSRTRQESSGFDNCPEIPPGTPNLGPRECDFLHTNASDMPYVKGRSEEHTSELQSLMSI